MPCFHFNIYHFADHFQTPQRDTTIFTVMSGLATQYNAVDLGQGFPDYPRSEEFSEYGFKGRIMNLQSIFTILRKVNLPNSNAIL